MAIYTIYSNGYVHEDSETITEPKKLLSTRELHFAEFLLKKHCKKNNLDITGFHSVKEIKTITGWESVEGTEKFY